MTRKKLLGNSDGGTGDDLATHPTVVGPRLAV